MSRLYAIPIAGALLEWFETAARKLPWRETHDPYAIWVSEIMLQQTRVEAVKPYYARFLAELPTIAALAACEEGRLMKLWEGLGYYSRARNLQKAAQIVGAEHGGALPNTAAELQRLPGIGPYTAGAIASIAFGEAVPAVDGNVLRVLSRLCNSEDDIALPQTKRAAELALLQMIPAHAAGAFNQAMMELGALICLPNTPPNCGACPLAAHCAGLQAGKANDLPVKSGKPARRVEQHTMFVLRREGAFALRRRGDKGLLRGLWELPNVPGHTGREALGAQLAQWGMRPAGEIARYSAKHIFTHVEWHMRVYALEVAAETLPPGWEWAGANSAHALPTAFRICLPENR